MKGLETSFCLCQYLPDAALKALTRYEGFGNIGNISNAAAIALVEGTDPL